MKTIQCGVCGDTVPVKAFKKHSEVHESLRKLGAPKRELVSAIARIEAGGQSPHDLITVCNAAKKHAETLP